MAWWDYGYQINGIAERTTLADGNTWNHEHIALLGRALVSHEQVAWETARHLADYVLLLLLMAVVLVKLIPFVPWRVRELRSWSRPFPGHARRPRRSA